jgi:hypothetical protein
VARQRDKDSLGVRVALAVLRGYKLAISRIFEVVPVSADLCGLRGYRDCSSRPSPRRLARFASVDPLPSAVLPPGTTRFRRRERTPKRSW